MSLSLREKQNLFMQLLPRLLDKINETHLCTGGDLWSKPEYKAHMANSVHYLRLAIDINLFNREGAFLTNAEAHRPFGEFWESLHELCYWGGNWDKDNKPFEKGEFDANHYSITHEGRK